jgi:hypothetical protein
MRSAGAESMLKSPLSAIFPAKEGTPPELVTGGCPRIATMNNEKRRIRKLLNKPVVANVTLMQCVQCVCYMAGTAVFARAVWSLARTELTIAQTVVWFLVCSMGPLIFIGIALLLPMLAAAEDAQAE